MKFTEIIKSNIVAEAIASTKKKFQLKKSSIGDSNIQDTIKLYAKSKGIDLADAEEQFKLRLAEKIKKIGTGILNKNANENAAESVAFEFIGKLEPEELDLSDYGISDNDDLLDRDYFFDLTQFVLGENAQFFPLRNPFERQAVRPHFFITPDHLPLMKNKALKSAAKNNCKTAFCTPSAEMVFNRKFSEQLAISALVNKILPKSKKYKSNGGPIPDHYVYLEFVIMHELLHFSAGDHFYTEPMIKKISKKYPKIGKSKAHTILNYVGDFINNWQLAKSGYEQLPIGLFSEDINYDKIESYEEIIDAVVAEIEAMNDKKFDDMKDEMDKSMDDHMDNPDDKPSPGGEASDPEQKQEGTPAPEPESEQEPDAGDSGEGDSGGDPGEEDTQDNGGAGGDPTDSDEEADDGSGGNSDGENQPTEQGADTEGSGGEAGDDSDGTEADTQDNGGAGTEPSDSDEAPDNAGEPGEPNSDAAGEESEEAADKMSDAIDDAMKKNQEKVDKRDDGNDDAASALETPDDDATDAEIAKKSAEASAKIELKATTTVVNWKKILKKMIPTDTGDVEDSFAKMSRQSTSTMVTAQQTGIGRITPGEIIVDNDKKGLVFVIDNSGSVSSVLNEFNQEILQLLKRNKKLLDNMYIIKFSKDFEVNRIDMKKMKYERVMNPEAVAMKKPKFRFTQPKNILELFKTSYGAGTYYTNEMHRVIKFFHDKNMNLIMFTDDDLVHDKHLKKFINLGIKRKGSIAMFITDDRAHQNMSDKFGKFRWMSILK